MHAVDSSGNVSRCAVRAFSFRGTDDPRRCSPATVARCLLHLGSTHRRSTRVEESKAGHNVEMPNKFGEPSRYSVAVDSNDLRTSACGRWSYESPQTRNGRGMTLRLRRGSHFAGPVDRRLCRSSPARPAPCRWLHRDRIGAVNHKDSTACLDMDRSSTLASLGKALLPCSRA
jgi:hypothetical protein